MRGGIVALAIAALAALGSDAHAQQPRDAAAAMRQATPEEVRQRLEAEEAAIAAEPAIDGLDKRLSHYLRTRLAGLAPLSAGGDAAPFICTGDFDGDGREDTAIVLQDRATGELRVIAFHQVTVTVNPGKLVTRDYQHYELTRTGPAAGPLNLDELAFACHGPGSFQSLDGKISLALKNHSIEFGATVYYFDGSRYQSLVIGD